MSTVKIDFSDLHDAARKARDASKEMDAYGRALPDKVSRPLDSLTGGSSGNTSTVRDLARRKQQQLQQRSDAYQDIARGLDAFADHAKETDEDVKRVIDRVADKRAENLNWLQKMMYQGYKFMNGIFGATEFGALVNDVIGWGDYLAKRKHEACKALLDWFKHGDGKYVLNIAIALAGIALAIAGAISTIATAIALFPASAILAVILIASTAVATAVTIADSVMQIMANAKALQNNSTEPGIARYHGNVSDLESWAKRETINSKLQSIAQGIDVAGKIAGFVSFLAGGFVSTGKDGTAIVAKSFKEYGHNMAKNFGFKYNDKAHNWKFTPKTFFGLLDSNDANKLSQTSKIVHIAETFEKGFSPFEKGLKFFQAQLNWNGRWDGLNDIKNIIKSVSLFAPGLKGYDKVYGWGSDIGLINDDTLKAALKFTEKRLITSVLV